MKKSIISLLALGIVVAAVSTMSDAQAAAHNTTCTMIDANQMRCVTNFAPAVSGGGTWFGPYWDADSLAPEGYTVESASLDVGGPQAPHRCLVDITSSPIAPNDIEAKNRGVAWIAGNPDTQWENHLVNGVWTNHRYGNGGFSICYVAQQTDRRVWFRYAIQGIEHHSVFGFEKIPYTPYVFPYYYSVGNQQIAEAAQLVAVYLKTPPPTPQAHKVIKGENLTMIAKAVYGNENWQKIYEANKEKIGNADAIFPGQDLTIPAP